ncbi:MAG: hypothetical protein JRI52_04945 [Deltaproteobacteria bacterium]|nr:hypothetical protein [Deltaproteobacteria bacterium]
MEGKLLSDLVEMNSSEAVLDEVKTILHSIYPDFDDSPIISAFSLTIKLFKGNYPGYQACNTEYHDIHHTIDTFLAMARLIHGAMIEDAVFTERQITQSLISALFHDAGYIQEEHDREGTGSKYTADHVQRSMDFILNHCVELGLSDEEVEACRNMILCTDLAVDISSIDFPSPKIETLSKMLGTADLLAQMADRTYLEKLLFLYHEFKEAKVGGYEGEVDLLRKTVGFYDFISQRLQKTLDATDRFMTSHFASRWDIQTNLYHEAIEKQKNYLHQILGIPDSDPRDSLKRGEIIHKVREKYGDNG